MRIVFETDTEILEKKAGDALSEILQERKNKPTLLLLAGGSAFQLLNYVDGKVLGNYLTIAMGDERFSRNEDENNFAQLEKTAFCTKATKAGVLFVGSKVKSGETLQAFTKKYEACITAWMKKNPHGEIIATLGVGKDGHTAGILPYPQDKTFFQSLFEKEDLFAGYDADKKTDIPLRVTMTMTFIRKNIKHAIVYATGVEKKAALLKTLASEGNLHETPARIIREIPKVTLFTDLPIYMLE